MKNLFLINILIIAIIQLTSSHAYSNNKLENLKYSNPKIKQIRKEIRKTIYIIKSNKDERKLPKLTFFKYKVKKNDTFWKILSKTSQNMDTILSCNFLSSPKSIYAGMTLFIPNMRGIIKKNNNKENSKKIIKQFNVKLKYVDMVNNTKNINKKHLFIPCGKISKLQKSLFLGTAFLYPLKGGRETSGFGTRRNPFNKKRHSFHKGLDIACKLGTKINASRNGKVIFTGYKGGYGKLVILKHEFGYETYYGHLSKILVKKGQSVRFGSNIALSGNTGRTTGPHLHFEIRRDKEAVNPKRFLRK